jgi:hypothetical protein
MLSRVRLALLALATLTTGCGGGLGAAGAINTAPPVDVAGAERCKIAARHETPLVTEWAASEKADLEGRLSSGQIVAVKFTGCELSIVDACRVPGKYAFRRTTLSTDTVEIQDADDLYAKLPLGAIGLEGELARSGRLAVRTTVAGQFRLDGSPPALQSDPACREATHFVTAVSVGAFSLLAGGAASVSGGIDAKIASAGGSRRREEITVRRAGEDGACKDATDAAPSAMCASPLQVFLSRLKSGAPDDARAEQEIDERRAKTTGVEVAIPAPSDASEKWTLHDASGRALCDAPCSRWVAPRSGYYIERTPNGDKDGVRIDLPNDFAAKPGSRVTAEYGPERGMPFLSKLTFYGVGLESGLVAVGMGIAAPFVGSDMRGFFIGVTIMFGAFAGASTWWFLYSDEKHFRTHTSAGTPALRIGVGPGFVTGTF